MEGLKSGEWKSLEEQTRSICIEPLFSVSVHKIQVREQKLVPVFHEIKLQNLQIGDGEISPLGAAA